MNPFSPFQVSLAINPSIWRLCLIAFLTLNCSSDTSHKASEEPKMTPIAREISDSSSFSLQIPVADGFDFPVGPPDAKSYYNANPFGNDLHLGDDWNGVGGGNTDLGDPVFSIAQGYVSVAKDFGGGWGNVIRIIHTIQIQDQESQIESLYAHLDSMFVREGTMVRRGQQIGSIGTADGVYLAHLHLEIRKEAGMPLGGGYSTDTTGYTDPTAFIRQHRPQPENH